MSQFIEIKGARVHNLKNISLKIPKNKLVVITGLSGSGKSSLAFDTIYAEGQRRYSESLSSYARQFLGLLDKPDVDEIKGLSPTIAIDQRVSAQNPRSTVATLSEIYDYLRLLFSRIGKPYCSNCNLELKKQTLEEIVEKISKFKNIFILAPLIKNNIISKNIIKKIKESGYSQIRLDNKFKGLEEIEKLETDKNEKHNLEVVLGRKPINKKELAILIKRGLDFGNGVITIYDLEKKKDLIFSQNFSCPKCGFALLELEPRNFSFNSPLGACPTCLGLGFILKVEEDLVIPNKKLTLAQGAIRPWLRLFSNFKYYQEILKALAQEYKFSLDVPAEKLPKEILKIIFYGTGEKRYLINNTFYNFEGVIPDLEKKYKETNSEFIRSEIERYAREKICPTCQGKRLKNEALMVKISDKDISQIVSLSIERLKDFFQNLRLEEKEKKIAQQLVNEILKRLELLIKVGLSYLSLERRASTLAAGELQRLRLATQIGSSLSNLIYILDEPTIGLHSRDTSRLIKILKELRDLSNTLIVVEHDEETIRNADYLFDLGPGAGEKGGYIVAKGTLKEILKNKESLTSLYLNKRLKISAKEKYRKGNGKKIVIKGARAYNLKNIDVEIPLGKFVCFTGVSGSGKSTLMIDILAKALTRKFYQSKDLPAEHKKILGLENMDKVIFVDQSPIGRTPRSNPATYTGVFTYIRDLFANLPEAKLKNYQPGNFSFNTTEGRCESCQGEGAIKIEMQFLPSVYVKCEVCNGKRYNKEALGVYYKDKNIANVLEMSVSQAKEFFKEIEIIKEKLQILEEVGLGYLKLGQPATTLSGGEAQRVKLATELGRRPTGKTLYILDEPTTGLHFEDIKKLLEVLNKLVDKGNSLLVIEHNLEVIKCADYIIDLGPEGGEKGGYVVAKGTPREIARVKKSYTGNYLKEILK